MKANGCWKCDAVEVANRYVPIATFLRGTPEAGTLEFMTISSDSVRDVKKGHTYELTLTDKGKES